LYVAEMQDLSPTLEMTICAILDCTVSTEEDDDEDIERNHTSFVSVEDRVSTIISIPVLR